jgi:hypothetical protein
VTRRVCLLLLLCVGWAKGHVGSPDVFYQGKAGPYAAMVTIRPPAVIPGVAEVEIRIPEDGVREVRVVPLPLTGVGSDHPPTPDVARRDTGDPHFFTSSVWLMAFGSYQVRIEIEGEQGSGKLAVPVPAIASLVSKMPRGLGVALVLMMVLLAAGLVTIVGASVREAALLPGTVSNPKQRRAAWIAMTASGVVVGALVFFGFRWWNSDERDYLRHIYKPLTLTAKVDRNKMSLGLTDPGWFQFRKTDDFIPDHGHLMHLFMIRMPGMDRIWHLHPEMNDNGSFGLDLPDMRNGHYKLFADVVHENGFPETLITDVTLPEVSGRPLSGDDAEGTAPPIGSSEQTLNSPLREGYRMVWVNGDVPLKARAATQFIFRVEDATGKPATDMQLYMGMVGHAEFMSDDASVFAHVHPDGSVPMASLMLTKMPMQHTHGDVPSVVSFPYGFPKPGRYRIFVQMQRNGHPETGIFDARVG